jgi:hypothetical protein
MACAELAFDGGARVDHPWRNWIFTIQKRPSADGGLANVPVYAVNFVLPDRTKRTTIIGRNGSGKTQAAAWLLSHAEFNKYPYVIVDYKYDALLNNVPRIEELGIRGRLPSNPGLYIVHPRPHEVDEVEDFLERVWDSENTGVYIDEAHMLPTKGAFQSLLTQGRSKRIPMIVVTQRPAWVSKFVFSEANYFYVFHLNDRQDRKRVEEFVPVNMDEPLPRYNGWWYDTDQNAIFRLMPVPDRDTILNRFADRMPRQWFANKPPKRRLM